MITRRVILWASGVTLAATSALSAQTPTSGPLDIASPRFQSELLYTACMASEPTNNLTKRHLRCHVMRGVCSNKPESAECQRVMNEFAVAKHAADPSFVLLTAASIDNLTVVMAMLEKGGNPNASIPGLGGWTPVSIAAAQGAGSAVSALLRAGGDPNLRNDSGRTALMFAASYGHTAIARDLVDHGADLNTASSDELGWTALIAAACNGRAETVGLLLDRRADAHLKDKQGRTALQCATQQGHVDVIRQLRK